MLRSWLRFPSVHVCWSREIYDVNSEIVHSPNTATTLSTMFFKVQMPGTSSSTGDVFIDDILKQNQNKTKKDLFSVIPM